MSDLIIYPRTWNSSDPISPSLTGPARAAAFSSRISSKDGNTWESGNNRHRKINTSALLLHICMNGECSYSGNGNSGCWKGGSGYSW